MFVNFSFKHKVLLILSLCVNKVIVSYVVRVEAFTDRRHQVKLPVLLMVPERVWHMVGVQTQDPEPGEQRAAARETPATRHVRNQNCTGENPKETESRGRPETQR